MGGKPIDYARSRAILIGVSAYQDKVLTQVPAAGNSVEGMRRMLTDPLLGGWPNERVSVYHEPTGTGAFSAELSDLASAAEDALIFYFVGHGTLSELSELCLMLADSSAKHPDLTGLPYANVKKILQRSPARVKTVILDSCFSGRAIEALSAGSVADSAAVAGATTITAADQAAHVVPIDQQVDACTSFTGHLLDVVAEGRENDTEYLTVQDAFALLQARLRNAGLPAPNQRTTDSAGLFPLARNAFYTPKAAAAQAAPDEPVIVEQQHAKTSSWDAMVVWRSGRIGQQDADGRTYGETGQGEEVQSEADRMWWSIADWRISRLRALVFVVNGEVARVREVLGVDEELTSDSGKRALLVSPPLESELIQDRLPGLPARIGDKQPATPGKIREYLGYEGPTR